DTSSPEIAFVIRDAETRAANLTVTAASTNATLVPAGNIVLGGNGTNRSLRVTPTSNQVGVTRIIVTVTDTDGGSTNQGFLLTVRTVNRPPRLGPIADLFIDEDSTTGPVSFTVSDDQTVAESVTVTVTSLNPVLVSSAGLAVSGIGSNRTVTV